MTVLDSETATAHLSVVTDVSRLAYADMAAFPGSVIVASR